MDIYINGTLRTDVLVEVGGKLEKNSAHKVSSKLNIRVPVASVINDCDYIKIVDNGKTVYAGTILNVDQTNIDNVDMPNKYHTLSITDNTDYIASRMADMSFPAGANITQILRGNKSGDTWYSSTLGTFSGLFDVRITPEGITLGTIDDFTNIVLSVSAALWGAYITDVLDDLCKAANAWWEITPDKVFNMRYINNADSAPYMLTNDSRIFNLNVQRDAYTLYSAVRVVGGQGQMGLLADDCGEDGTFNFTHGSILEREDATHARVKYPIYSIESFYSEVDQDADAPVRHYYHVGFKGVNDNDDNFDALTTYGGTEIELKSNATPFPDLGLSNNATTVTVLSISYYPLTKVVTRIVDSALASDIASQRGGTGVIEYTLTDDSITTLITATEAGLNFLKNGAKRAVTIKFDTYLSGADVGQTFKNCDIPYCGISGDYRVTSVTTTAVLDQDVGLIWKYTVEASNIDYRDATQALFSKGKKSAFKLGDDFPNVDGAYIDSTVEVQTELTCQAYIPMTWGMRDTSATAWASSDTQALTWAQYEAVQGIIKEWSFTGNYLTSTARNELAKILSGGTSTMSLNLNSSMQLDKDYTAEINANSVVNENEIVTNFYVDQLHAQYLITEIDTYNNSGTTMQTVPVNIDKSNTNPIGKFALSITKRDVVL